MKNKQIVGLIVAALAFVFAIQRYMPAPFYAFDEVDANLDGINVERLANIILGLPVGDDTDTLPKRLTDEEQVPGDKRTKVPLDKMKKSYYIIRGWKDGAPTMRTLRKLGIKVPECAKEVYPYGKG